MPRFDLTQYEEVKDRIPRFWAKYEDGAIVTDLIESGGGSYIVKASLINGSGQIIATGLAQETVGSSPVNKTSALENCETSAIGRALANAGFSSGPNRPSREEMAKANRGTDSANASPAGNGDQSRPAGPRPASAKQLFTLNQLIEVHGPPDGCPWPLPKKGDDDELSMRQASAFLDVLKALPEPPPNVRVSTLRPVEGPVDLNDIADYSGEAF